MSKSRSERVNALIDEIKSQQFDLDADLNMKRAKKLLAIRIKTEKALFEVTERFRHEKYKLKTDEEFMKKGKNAETREALIELELAGTDYDSIPEMKMILKMISGVEHTNELIMDLFFRSGK